MLERWTKIVALLLGSGIAFVVFWTFRKLVVSEHSSVLTSALWDESTWQSVYPHEDKIKGEDNGNAHSMAWRKTCFAPELAQDFECLHAQKPLCTISAHNISRGMCERAISNYGDETRLVPMLKKIVGGECVRWIVLGGSVSLQHSTPHRPDPDHPRARYRDCYVYHIEDLLNSRYPCNGSHVVENLSVSARGSDFHVSELQSPSNFATYQKADMIIVEASANDIGTIERNVQGEFGEINQAMFWTEALIRHVRRNFPHLGMLWLEMATRNYVGHRKKLKTGSIRLPPYRLDAAHDHLEVLSYYDLPQLDILRMIGPGWSEAGWNFREGCYFSDPIHPTRYGHNISASVLMFAIEGMLQRAEAQDPTTSVQGNQFNSSALPPPMVMDTLMAEFFESKFVESIEFNKEKTFSRHVKANENWYFGTDLAKKPKTIMTTSHNSCITIDLEYSGRISILTVSLFHSYEGVGIARVGLSEKCTATSNTFAPVGKEEVYDCLWSEHASVAQLHILPQDFSLLGHSGCAKYLRVCSNEDPDREAKLKLFSTSFSRKS